jgi:arylsulfatase A-like enzyme
MNYKPRYNIWKFAALGLALLTTLTSIAARPNILLVIADDIGVDSHSLYNTNSKASLPPTPNINSLYTNGVLFRSAYAYPSCSATRAALLTGRYGFRTGWGLAIDVDSTTVLLGNEPTLPKILSQNPQLGYRDASFGKWHLGFKPTDPNLLGGWSHFSGAPSHSLESFFRWQKIVDGKTSTSTNYATTDNVNDAISWIQQQGTNNWFLWLAFNAPHAPFHKPPDGLHSYTSLSTSQSEIDRNPRPYFEAATEAMDTELGRLLSTVDRSNTVIIFVGDNGTPQEVVQPPYTSARAKFTLYEGGTHVPLIISGPVVKNPHRETAHPVHVVDLYATILEFAGAEVPNALPANVISDSHSLVPFLTSDESTFSRDWLFTEQFPATNLYPDQQGRTIRDESLKLIRLSNGTRSVYDLLLDPTEKTNLVARLTAEQSARVDALTSILTELQNVPHITAVSNSANRASISVDYIQGAPFSLRRADTLSTNSNSWKSISASRQMTNYTVVLTDLNATNPASFYRVSTPAR